MSVQNPTATGAVGREAARSPETVDARSAGGIKIADPGPLGLAAFAMTTFVLSMFNADLVSRSGEAVTFGLALTYGGLAQLLAGMWEFRTGNTFGAVAFTSYGAFWLSFWAFVQFYASSVPAADAGHAVGLYLIAWGIFTAYMFIASLRTTGAIAVVFVTPGGHVLPARDRERPGERHADQGGRLVRPGDGSRRLVCVVRGGHELPRSAARLCRSCR